MKGFFYGSATAIITPFDENGVNFDTFAELIEHQITGGTDAIVFLGTTGEPATMSLEEEFQVMDYVVKKVAGRCKVIIGCGSNDTNHAIEMAKKAESYGADGLLAVTPYYNKCTQNGLVAYYKAICDAVSIPVIAYNVPGRTGVEIQPATMAKIAEIAEATGNSLNKTAIMLIETILPYMTIETIMEPRKRVSMQLPDRDAGREKACSTTD